MGQTPAHMNIQRRGYIQTDYRISLSRSFRRSNFNPFTIKFEGLPLALVQRESSTIDSHRVIHSRVSTPVRVHSLSNELRHIYLCVAVTRACERIKFFFENDGYFLLDRLRPPATWLTSLKSAINEGATSLVAVCSTCSTFMNPKSSTTFEFSHCGKARQGTSYSFSPFLS